MYFYFVNSWYENGGKKMAGTASLEQNANITLSCKQKCIIQQQNLWSIVSISKIFRSVKILFHHNKRTWHDTRVFFSAREVFSH